MPQPAPSILDAWLPRFDVSEHHERIVACRPERALEIAMQLPVTWMVALLLAGAVLIVLGRVGVWGAGLPVSRARADAYGVRVRHGCPAARRASQGE